MEVREGYKLVDNEVIPEDWDIKAIGDEVDLLTGFPFTSAGYSTTGVRLLRGSNVKRGETDWTDENTQYWSNITQDIARYELKEGDLVIAMDGSLVGRSYAQLARNDLPALLLQRVARIRSNKLDIGYLGQFIGSNRFVNYCDSVKTVTAIPHISSSDIRNFKIPIPRTVSEQKKIAKALSDVDALISSLEKLIDKKQNIKQGAMYELLTGKKRLQGFEGEWVVKQLGDIAEIIMGQSPSSVNYNNKGEGMPLIQGNADIFNRKTIKRIFTTEVTKKGKRGDIIMSVRAPVGEVSRAVFDVCLGRGVCAVRYSNDFLYHALISKESTWAKYSKGSTFDSVNSADVKTLEIELPQTLEEQIAITSILSDMDAEISALEKKLEKYRMIKQGMMQELLTGKTRLV